MDGASITPPQKTKQLSHEWAVIQQHNHKGNVHAKSRVIKRSHMREYDALSPCFA